MTTSLEYESLARGVFEIRLLQILPGEWDDPICIHLAREPLENEPEYFALSYTWAYPFSAHSLKNDESEIFRCVNVEGKEIHVRRNLHDAMQHMRKLYDSKQRWWIDAICINQQDVLERNEQVANMADIYRWSSGVVAWLGLASATTSFVMKTLTRLHYEVENGVRNVEWGNHETVAKFDEWGKSLAWELVPADSTDFVDGLTDLMNRTYWKRAWVKQEVCERLRGSVLIYCGEHATLMEAFPVLNVLIGQLRNYVSRRIHDDIRSGIQRRLDLLETAMANFRTTQSVISLCVEARAASSKPSLLDLLAAIRSSLASDPRDKIYSIMALGKWSEGIGVSYSNSAQNIYVLLVLHSIEHFGDFRILSHCVYPALLDQLPSWAPDWTDRNRGNSPFICRSAARYADRTNDKKLYAATNNSEAFIRYSEDGHVILVKGFKVDTISFVSSTFDDTNEAGIDIKEGGPSGSHSNLDLLNIICDGSWLSEWSSSPAGAQLEKSVLLQKDSGTTSTPGLTEVGSLIYRPTLEPLSVAYSKVLAADVIWDQARLCYSRISDTLLEHDSNQFRDTFVGAVHRLLRGRVFAATNLGLFALAPEQSQIGDEILLIQGGDIPLVVRPHGKGYSLIGECYVHGIMDGTTWEKLTRDSAVPYIRIV